MSSTNEEIKIPEAIEQECFNIYNGVLTHSKKQALKKLIRYAYLAGRNQSASQNEN